MGYTHLLTSISNKLLPVKYDKKKYIYYIIFGITFLLFSLVQDNIRPNYDRGNSLIIYFLGVIPNFLPGIGLPSFFYVIISEVFKPHSFFFKERLKLSIYIYMFGLICKLENF